MNIETGWRFMSADFSIQAAGHPVAGHVALVRSPKELVRWHKMPEPMKEDDSGPPIYVNGSGMTIEKAIINANMAAAHALPIPYANDD